MMVCHWISHWTPQLASTFAATSPQSAARRHASDAPLTAAPAPETLMASTLMLMARQPSLPSRSRRRQHLAVQAAQLTEQPRPRPEEGRPGLERGRDRLAGRAAPGEETPELVEARAVGLDEVVHDLVDRPLTGERRARRLRGRQRRQELVARPKRFGDPRADLGHRQRRGLRPEILTRLLLRLVFELPVHRAFLPR